MFSLRASFNGSNRPGAGRPYPGELGDGSAQGCPLASGLPRCGGRSPGSRLSCGWDVCPCWPSSAFRTTILRLTPPPGPCADGRRLRAAPHRPFSPSQIIGGEAHGATPRTGNERPASPAGRGPFPGVRLNVHDDWTSGRKGTAALFGTFGPANPHSRHASLPVAGALYCHGPRQTPW